MRRLAHTPSVRTLELIRREIETFALIFPNVAPQLKHSRTEAKIMTVPRVRYHPHDDRNNSNPCLKTTSTLEAFRRIFGRTLVQQTHLVNSSYDSLRIEGFISLTGTSAKVRPLRLPSSRQLRLSPDIPVSLYD